MDNKPNVFPEKPSGLDLEKQSRSSGRGGAFSLTSLFIELIDRIPGYPKQGGSILPSRDITPSNRARGRSILPRIYTTPSNGRRPSHFPLILQL